MKRTVKTLAKSRIQTAIDRMNTERRKQRSRRRRSDTNSSRERRSSEDAPSRTTSCLTHVAASFLTRTRRRRPCGDSPNRCEPRASSNSPSTSSPPMTPKVDSRWPETMVASSCISQDAVQVAVGEPSRLSCNSSRPSFVGQRLSCSDLGREISETRLSPDAPGLERGACTKMHHAVA